MKAWVIVATPTGRGTARCAHGRNQAPVPKRAQHAVPLRVIDALCCVRRRALICVFVALFSLGGSSSFADSGASGERNILSQGFGVRALALGGAYVSLSNDADATFWNPAWLSRLDRQAFSATHARFFQDTEINSAGWGHNFDNLGAVGVSFTRLGIDEFPAVNNWVVSQDAIGYSTSLATVSYARSFGEHFSAGLTGKALYESLFEKQDYGFGFDIGLAASKGHLNAGIILRDVSSSDIRIGATGENQPFSSQFGLALDSLSLTAQLSVTASAEIELIESRSAIAHLGAEALLYDRLALRAGLSDRDATFGAGFVFDSYRLDYGFQLKSDIGDTHLFGFSVLFGSSAKQRERSQRDKNDALGKDYANADRRKRAQESLRVAKDFESAGKLDSALVHYRIAQSLDSSSPDAAAHLAMLEQQIREQARQDSIAIAESAGLDSLSLAELASQLAVGLAEELRAEKRFGSALRVLQKALSEDPDSPDLASAVTRIVAGRDEWKAEKVIEAGKASSTGDYVAVLDIYTVLLREFPRDAQIRHALSSMGSKLKVSDLLARAGRKLDSELYEDAKKYVERALTIDSANVAARGLLEKILRSITPDESIRAISDNAEDWAQMSRALSLVRVGDLKGALQIFETLLEKYPHNSELLRNKEQVELRLLGVKSKK